MDICSLFCVGAYSYCFKDQETIFDLPQILLLAKISLPSSVNAFLTKKTKQNFFTRMDEGILKLKAKDGIASSES